MSYRTIGYAAAALLITIAPAGPALAAPGDEGSWTVYPVPTGADKLRPARYFVLSGKPRTVIKEKAEIANNTGKTLRLRLYPADAYNTTAGGAFTVRLITDRQRDVGSWVRRLPAGEIKIEAGKKAVIPFEIMVPANATPGDHVGALMALNAADAEQRKSGSVSVKVQRQVGARIYLRVLGPLKPSLQLRGSALDRAQPPVPMLTQRDGTIRYTLTNSGNTVLQPKVRIEAKGLFGTKVLEPGTKQLGELLPGQSTQYTIKWPGLPSLGPARLRIHATAGTELSDRTSIGFWAVPWPTVAAVLALLALTGTAWWIRRRRARG